METTTLDSTKENLIHFLKIKTGQPITTEQSLILLQVQAQIAMAEEINGLRKLLIEEMKRGGALNK